MNRIVAFVLVIITLVYAIGKHAKGPPGKHNTQPESSQTVIKYDFEVAEALLAPDGMARVFIVVNGSYPGPEIHANVGDKLLITVNNHMFSRATAIHWHGFSQRGTPFMDGASGITQCPINPGASFTYEFTCDQAGTFWYHAHTTLQYGDGLFGALIVHDPNDPWGDSYDEERTIMISDPQDVDSVTWGLTGFVQLTSAEQSYRMAPYMLLVNGRGKTDCSLQGYWSEDPLICGTGIVGGWADINVEPGKRYRLRIVAATMNYPGKISIDGLKMKIISVDGFNTAGYDVDSIELSPAQRYDVIIEIPESPSQLEYWINVESPISLDAIIFNTGHAVLRLPGSSGGDPAVIPPPASPVEITLDNADLTLSPLDPQPIPEPNRTLIVNADASFAPPAGFVMGDGTVTHVGIHTIQPPVVFHQEEVVSSDQYGMVYEVKYGEYVEVVFSNIMAVPLHHPMHLHGHRVAIVARGTVPFDASTVVRREFPIWRDTWFVGGFEWALVRFKADNPGLWLLHCHADVHMAFGLTVLIKEATDRLPPIPEGWPTCSNYPPTLVQPPHGHGPVIPNTALALWAEGMSAMASTHDQHNKVETYPQRSELYHPGSRTCPAEDEDAAHRILYEGDQSQRVLSEGDGSRSMESRFTAVFLSFIVLGNIGAVLMLYRRQNRLLAERTPLMKN